MRIFSWEEVLDNKIPSQEDFQLSIDLIKSTVEKDDRVEVAVLLGSALRGDYESTSDIDVLVGVEDLSFLFEAGEIIQKANQNSVPIEMIPFDTFIAKTIRPFDETSFLYHIRWAAENDGLIKGDPFSVLNLNNITYDYHWLEKSLDILQTKILKAVCELERAGPERYHFLLGKLMDAPINIVREMMWAFGPDVSDQDKTKLIQGYKAIASQETYKMLEKVLITGARYKELLTVLIAATPTEKTRLSKEYNQVLQDMKELGPIIVGFLRANVKLCEHLNTMSQVGQGISAIHPITSPIKKD